MKFVGLGAHKSMEIAGRLQTSATSLTRGLKQLQQLGYVQREVPYGESERRSKKARYRLADPFLRLWFRGVAPHRGNLQSASRPGRLKILKAIWPRLRAEAWEQLCRQAVPRLSMLGNDWHPAGRHWALREHEWDVVSRSLDGGTVLLGECRSLAREATASDVGRMVRELQARPLPRLSGGIKMPVEYVLFVPSVGGRSHTLPPHVHLLDGRQVFDALV